MRELQFSGVGRFCDDPEAKSYKKGKETGNLAKFCLAFNRSGKDEGADFFNMTAFGGVADVLTEFCHKGDQIYVRGIITTSTDGEGDDKRWFTNYVVQDFQLLSNKKDEGEKKPYRKK